MKSHAEQFDVCVSIMSKCWISSEFPAEKRAIDTLCPNRLSNASDLVEHFVFTCTDEPRRLHYILRLNISPSRCLRESNFHLDFSPHLDAFIGSRRPTRISLEALLASAGTWALLSIQPGNFNVIENEMLFDSWSGGKMMGLALTSADCIVLHWYLRYSFVLYELNQHTFDISLYRFYIFQTPQSL